MKTHPDYQTTILRDHSTDGLRSGEGSIAALRDGRLLLLFSEFVGGGADHSAGFIASSVCRNGVWSEPEPVFQTPPGALNCMSASVLRLRDGRLGCVFCLKHSLSFLTPMWSWSDDDGITWAPPQPITSEQEYFVVNNDRLVELSDGTLALPYALHEGMGRPSENPMWDPVWNARCGLFLSRDSGATWSRSPFSITHTPEVFHPPLFLPTQPLPKEIQYQFENRLGAFQEPGLVELPNGGLLLYMRSPYSVYRCFADNPDSPWTDCAPMPGLNVCMGPQTVRRIPGTDRLVLFYNDRGEIPFATPEFSMRTPLSVAVSDDCGRSWNRRGRLEDDSRNYCYFSLLFLENRFVTSYYESAEKKNPDGSLSRVNLASLKIGTGPASLF